MNLNLKINELSPEQLETIKFKCLDCDYWFNYGEYEFFKGLFEVRSLHEMVGFFRGKLFEKKGISIKKNKDKRTKNKDKRQGDCPVFFFVVIFVLFL